jgi:glycerophosphoryl diester phosphodiesterase
VAVLRALRATRTLDDAMVISMDAKALRRTGDQAPGLLRGLVFPRRARWRLIARTEAVGADWLIASAAWLQRSARMVARARGRGLRVGAYVVNDSAALDRLVEIGVDSLASDCPLRLAGALDALRTRGLTP